MFRHFSAPEESKGSPEDSSRGEETARGEPPLAAELLLLAMKLAFVIGFVAMVFLFLFGMFQAPDESMDPALREGDLVVYYRLQKDYVAGDVIVVDDGGALELRRVVAVAGDVVDFSEDGLIVNGYRQSEDRIYTDTEPFTEGISYPVTVGEGQVFVMGDNRPQSKDSRLYGPVDIETGTEGEVMTVVRRRNF